MKKNSPRSMGQQIRSLTHGCPRHRYGAGIAKLHNGEFCEGLTYEEQLDTSAIVIGGLWEYLAPKLDEFVMSGLEESDDVMRTTCEQIAIFACGHMIDGMRSMVGDSVREKILLRYLQLTNDQNTHRDRAYYLKMNLIDSLSFIGGIVESLEYKLKIDYRDSRIQAKIDEGGIEALSFKERYCQKPGDLERLQRDFLSYLNDYGRFNIDVLDLKAMGICADNFPTAEFAEILESDEFVDTFMSIGQSHNVAIHALQNVTVVDRAPMRVVNKWEKLGKRFLISPEDLEFVERDGGKRAVRFKEDRVGRSREAYHSKLQAVRSNERFISRCPASAAVVTLEGGDKSVALIEYTKWVMSVMAQKYVPICNERGKFKDFFHQW